MVVDKRDSAQYLTREDIDYAFTLYRINFGKYWEHTNSDIRIDALEALEAVSGQQQ